MAQPSGVVPEPVVAPAAESIVATPVQDAPETDFAALTKEFEQDDVAPPEPKQGAAEPAVAPPAPPTEPAPPAQPVVVPPPLVEPAPPAVTLPPVVVQPPAAPEIPPPTAATPAPVELAPAMTEVQIKAKRGELITAFASNYRLSEDDKVKLQSDPDEVLPRLAGNIAVDVLESVVRVVMGNIPQMIQATMQQAEVARGARDAFFTQFPDLNRPEYIPTLQQVTQMYRQMNPKVPYDKATEAIGRHARIMLGLASLEGSSPAAAPALPLRPATPLQPGAAATRPAAPAVNEWDALARYESIDT